jgi:hypothetical protein
MLNLGLTALVSIVIVLSILVAITTPYRKLATQNITVDHPTKDKE